MQPALADQLNWVLTDRSKAAFLSPQPSVPFVSSETPAATATASPNTRRRDDDADIVVVRSATLLQEIYGFGGALTESSASVFEKLTPGAQARFLEAYYGDTGHRYTMARTHIGSCDFSLDYYAYQSQKDDFNMTTFNMTRDHQRLIPFIKRVQAAIAGRNATGAAATTAADPGLRIVSSPWSPPGWLKTCDQRFCLVDCGLRQEETDKPYRSAYALYISKYLDEMAANGIKPWAITPQNEPLVSHSH